MADAAMVRPSLNMEDGTDDLEALVERLALDPYLLDPTTGERHLLRAATGRSTIQDVSRDRRWVVESRLLSRGDNDLYLLDLAGGGETLLTPHRGPGTFVNARFAPDGRTISLISNGDRDLLALGAITLDGTGQPGPIRIIAERADAELGELALSADGATLALIWNVAGRNKLAFYDIASGAMTAGPALPGEVVGGISFTPDGAQLLLGVSGARVPQDLWLLERRAGELRQLTRSPHPGTAPGHWSGQRWLVQRLSLRSSPPTQERPEARQSCRASGR